MADYSRELAAFENIDHLLGDMQKKQPFKLEKAASGKYIFGRHQLRQFKDGVAKDEWFQVKLDESLQGQKLKDLWEDLPQVFEAILNEVPASATDLVRIHIRHQLLTKGDIKVRMQPRGELSANTILTTIEQVLQSHETMAVDDSFEIGIGLIHIPSGSGRKQVTDLHGPNNSLTTKRSIVKIVNQDELCLARAIAVCLGHLKWRAGQMAENAYKQLQNPKRRQQEYAALDLHHQASIPTDQPCTLQDVNTFEKALDLQIVVIGAAQANRIIYAGEDKNTKVFVYLVPPEQGDGPGHFHAMVNPSGFMGRSYICNKCLKVHDYKKTHKCDHTCQKCKTQDCPKGQEVQCPECNVKCQSPACFDAHKKVTYYQSGKRKGQVRSSSVCSTFWQCLTCKRCMDRSKRTPEQHKCNEWLCSCCQQYVYDMNHTCYLQRLPPKASSNQYIFFDVESQQDTGKHIPNLIVAHISCSHCLDSEDSTCPHCGSRCARCKQWDDEHQQYSVDPCNECGQREVVFRGSETQNEFGRWLFQPCHVGYCIIAHNMKGYDGYFLMDHLIKNGIRHKVIFNGSKIMSITIQNGLKMRVVDSLNFLPMKLAKLPKAFELAAVKGEFPHWFNTEANQDYIGPYPDPLYYGINYMSSEDRTSFLAWHEEQQGKEFNFQAEILKYCRADVQILRQACLKFRHLLLTTISDKDAGIDPFQYLTIASVCMAIYRAKFLWEEYEVTVNGSSNTLPAVMKDGQLTVMMNGRRTLAQDLDIASKKYIRSPIGQVPSAGYVKFDNYSKESIQWLEWVMECSRQEMQPIDIQHALNGGEYHIPGTNFKADGFCKATGTIYEFFGCLWHGCVSCHRDRDVQHPRTKQPVSVLYIKTMKRKQQLEQMGYKVVVCWEHEFHQKIKTDPDMKTFVNSLDVQDRLKPRDSFFGGRTNAIKLHYKAQEGEKIKYVDFTSLYPFVNSYRRYPVGHPEIITDKFQPLQEYFGIAKVKVLPPRKLYHPVLPYTSDGKLKFPLCRTCVDSEEQDPCQCTNEQRAITGTWCIPELLKALEKGYILLCIYEVYHWPETTQYDRTTNEGGLFAEYMRTFLKIKQEASGWPAWCHTEVEKQRYIENYMKHEGIQLDQAKIQKNGSLRCIAKLALNSLWGKFGQRDNLKQSEYLYEAKDLFEFITDSTKDVHDFHIINDDTIQLEWQHEEGFVPDDIRTNIFLATFTTCWARLELYTILDKLGDRVLYHDTDSVIYVSRPGEYEPPLGDYLGDLTDELDGGWISEYVSGGPKNYAYRTNMEIEVCKVRGFTLNYANSQLINFQAVKDLVLERDYTQKITVTNPHKICRKKRDREIISREEKKDYGVVYTKRVIQPNFDTLPYGY